MFKDNSCRRVDVEFESDVLDVASCLRLFQVRSESMAAATRFCEAVRKAKLLLFSLERRSGTVAHSEKLLRYAQRALIFISKLPPKLFRENAFRWSTIIAELQVHENELNSRISSSCGRAKARG